MQSSIRHHLAPLILPVYLPMLALSTGMAAVTPGLPGYLRWLGASVAMIGIILSLRGAGNLAADIPAGVLVGRFGIRLMMRWTLVVGAASNLVPVFVENAVVIAVSVFVSGAAVATTVLGMMAYVRLSTGAQFRGRALSLAGGVLRVGALIGPLLGGVMADHLGMRWVFGLRVATFVAAFVAASRGIDGSHEQRARAGTRPLLVALRGRYYALVTVGAAVFVLMLLRASRTIILPLWGDRLGLSVTAIGAVMSAAAAVDLAMFVPAGIIADRAGRKVSGSLCIGLFSAGVLLIPVTNGVAGFIIAGIVIGLGNGLGAGINMTLGTDLAPDGAVGSFLGLWRLFGDVGAMLGPAVVGAAAAAVGLSGALIVTGGLGVAGMLVMALLAPETRQSREWRPIRTVRPDG